MKIRLNKLWFISPLVVLSAHAAEIDWFANWNGYASGGILTLNEKIVDDNWVVGLYQSTGTNPLDGFNTSDWSANFLASSFVNIDTSGPVFTWSFQLANSRPNMANNIPIYSVLFNTTNSSFFSSGGAPGTYSYLVLDDPSATAFNSGSEGIGQGINHPYNLSTIPSSNTWQAIPEPTTFLLFAMGGFGAWLLRRKNMI